MPSGVMIPYSAKAKILEKQCTSDYKLDIKKNE
jgi:hypothetical protein